MKRLWPALLPVTAFAYDINVTFTPPTQWTDGSPLDINEIVYYETRHTIDGIDQPVITVQHEATSFTVKSEMRGEHCFTMFTVATDAIEQVWSDPSNTACKTISRGKPGKPENVSVP